MNARAPVAILIVVLVAATGCAAPQGSPGEEETWVGTITTEGDVTTVVNESGSVWGGTATLVEEASIGVAVGPEEYMLGEISQLYATDDEIYLIDHSVSRVRVYDLAGVHLRSFGRAGQGPGELGEFLFGMAIDDDGRIYIGDLNNQRINIYTRAGAPAGELPLPARRMSGMASMVFADNGGIWLSVRLPAEDGSSVRYGYQVHNAEGPVGDPFLVPEIEYEQLFIRVQGRDLDSVPFAPRLAWTFSHDQALIAGASDRYAFQMIRPTGETIIVERYWEPAPVDPEEAEYWRRYMIAVFRGRADGWNGENIPAHKPAFMQLFPAHSGELWVLRQGSGGLGACELEPEEAMTAGFGPELSECLYPNLFFDVFDRDGRYLGRVDGLQLNSTPPFISGNTVLATFQDEAGTIMVKRYRLALPGEE